MFYPIIPVTYPRMTKRDRWKKRPAVEAFFAFRDEIKLRRVTVPIPCHVIFWMPMPASWSKKKKAEMNKQPHTQTPDIDNLLKALLDSVFQGTDAKVWSVWPEKRWSTNPGIQVLPV